VHDENGHCLPSSRSLDGIPTLCLNNLLVLGRYENTLLGNGRRGDVFPPLIDRDCLMHNRPNDKLLPCRIEEGLKLVTNKICSSKEGTLSICPPLWTIEDHVNDRVSTKLGGVVKEMGAVYPSPPVRVPTKGRHLATKEGNIFLPWTSTTFMGYIVTS